MPPVQLTLLDQRELQELVPALPPIEEGDDHGAVFTTDWVVDVMLDLCNYRVERHLSKMRLLEPSCGDRAFLQRIIKRMSDSLRTRGHT
jgi:hypothetical protein